MNRSSISCLAFFLAMATGAYAQGVTGTIAGTVTDASGGRLAQARIRVTTI